MLKCASDLNGQAGLDLGGGVEGASDLSGMSCEQQNKLKLHYLWIKLVIFSVVVV